MLYLWIVLIAIAALVVLPNLIGLFLPERYVGHARAEYEQSPDVVWSALVDHGAHPMTGKMCRTTEPLPDDGGLATWAETMAGNERIVVRTLRSEPPTSLVRGMESAALPMTSEWTYTLEPNGDGCVMTLDGVTYIRKGSWLVPLFRFMMVVGGGVKKGLVIQMRMIADTLGGVAKVE